MLTKPLCFLCVFFLSACSGTGAVFAPRSDYGLAPEPRAYTEPGDCQGGARLRAISLSPPEYSRRAYRTGQQGWVVVRLNVDAEGRTRRIRVLDSQPDGVFDRAAREAARSWRFQSPGDEGLERCVVVMDFRLGEGRIGL